MQADEAKAVAVQDTVLVTPTDVKESSVHSLSNLDQLNAFIPCYFPILYFFRSGAETPAAATKLVASLKQALAEALDLYPVLAGRLRKGKGGLLEVEVNGKGVEFSVATTEARLDAWEDLRFCSIALQLVPNKPFMFGEMLIGAPLACVQVTTFQCGGVAISLSFLHALGDMQAMAEFVEAWACIHRDPLSPPITPCLDTAALLRSRDPPTVDVPIDGLMQLSGIQHGQDSENKEGEGEGSPNSLLAAMSTVDAVLRMGDAKVAEAVREVESGPYSYGRASSFEVVAGLLWVALTRARDLPPDSSTRFALPVNMRQRWRPPLPPRFFGNAAVPAMAIARSGDLVDRHFSYAAKLVHESIGTIDAKYGQAAVDWLQMQLQQHGMVGLRDMLMNGRDVHASVMLGFPLYDLDFGWGATHHFALPFTAQLNGAMVVMPSPKGGRSRDLQLWLKMEHMNKLLADPFFSHYLEGEEQMVKEISRG